MQPKTEKKKKNHQPLFFLIRTSSLKAYDLWLMIDSPEKTKNPKNKDFTGGTRRII